MAAPARGVRPGPPRRRFPRLPPMSEEPTDELNARAPHQVSGAGILAIGAAAAVLVGLASVCVHIVLQAAAAGVPAALPRLLDAGAVAYAQLRPKHEWALTTLPAAWRQPAQELRDRGIQALADQLGVKPKALSSAWRHVVSVELGVSPGDVAAWGTGDEPVVVCLRFDSKEYLRAFLAEHVTLREPIPIQDGSTYSVAATLFLTPMDDLLFLTRNVSQMGVVLERAGPDTVGSLADEPRFKASANARGNETTLWGYVNPAAAGGDGRPRRARPPVARACLKLVPPAAFRCDLGPADVAASGTLFLPRPKTEADAKQPWLGLRNASAKSLLRFVPVHADWFVAASLQSPAGFWRQVSKLAAQATPKQGLRSEFEVAVEQWGNDYAIDLKQEIMPLLGNEAAVFRVPAGRAGARPGVVFAIELAAAEQMAVILGRMEASPALRNVRYATLQVGSYTLRAAELEEGLSYGVVGDCLLISHRVAALRAAISAAVSGANLSAHGRLSDAIGDLSMPCALLAGAHADHWIQSIAEADGVGWVVLAAAVHRSRVTLAGTARWRAPAGESGTTAE